MCMLTASGIIVMKDELNQNSYIQRTIHILYMKKNDRNKTNRNKNQANPKDVAETGGGLLFLIFFSVQEHIFNYFFKETSWSLHFYKLRNKLYYIVLGLFSRLFIQDLGLWIVCKST